MTSLMFKEAGGTIPVPDTPKETVSPGTPPDTLAEIVPVAPPTAEGVKVTGIWQLAPGAIPALQLLRLGTNAGLFDAGVPMLAEPETASLVNVTVCAGLVVLISCGAKISGDGLAVTYAPFTYPFRLTICVPPELFCELSVKTSEPDELP